MLKWSCLVAALLSATVAHADSVVVLNQDTTKYSSGPGGEMRAMAFDLPNLAPQAAAVDGISFQTFCIETNESFNQFGVYDVILSNAARHGGYAGGDPDPLSDETAWLYTQFSNKALSGYDYTLGAGRISSAGDLQNAIWFLEDEQLLNGSLSARSQGWIDAAHAAVLAGYVNHNVYVMNLTSTDTQGHVTFNQDQLVMVAPLPAVAWQGLALLGGMGLTCFMRRRRLLA